MKIYIAMLSEDCNQNQVPLFAYQNKDEAVAFAESWNKDKKEQAKKDAEENGQTYDEWVGAYPDYVYIQQVELL